MRSGRPWMPDIEVRAVRSFLHHLHPQGRFLHGRRYQVDTDDPAVQALIDGGYLVPTNKLEVTRVVDLAGIDEFLGSGVGVRRTRPQKSQAGEPEQWGEVIEYGQGEPVQATD